MEFIKSRWITVVSAILIVGFLILLGVKYFTTEDVPNECKEWDILNEYNIRFNTGEFRIPSECTNCSIVFEPTYEYMNGSVDYHFIERRCLD